jgi:hypothetical protein
MTATTTQVKWNDRRVSAPQGGLPTGISLSGWRTNAVDQGIPVGGIVGGKAEFEA